jgi:hypothetical protein
VRGEWLVEETVVAIEEVHDTGIALNKVAHEHPRLLLEGVLKALRVVFLELLPIRRHGTEVAEVEPAIEETGHEGIGAFVFEHPSRLGQQHLRLGKVLAHELRIRHRGPQEVGQS